MGSLAILQTLATLTAVTLNVCPIFDDIPAIKHSRTTGDRSPILFVAIWTNACLWICYGIFINAFNPIATTNLTGFLSGSYFLYTFKRYAPPLARTQLAQYFVAAAAFVVAVYTYCFIFPSPEEATTKARLGAMCCIVTIGVYASPLGTVVRAIQLKSNKPISLFFALVGSANSFLWTGYGLLTDDAWVYAPSIVGLILSLTQAAVYLFYRQGRVSSPKMVDVGAKRHSLNEFLLTGGECGPTGAGALDA